MFKNPEKKLKIIGYCITVIGSLASIIYGIVIWCSIGEHTPYSHDDAYYIFWGLLVIVAGIFLSYDFGVLFHSIGKFLENSHKEPHESKTIYVNNNHSDTLNISESFSESDKKVSLSTSGGAVSARHLFLLHPALFADIRINNTILKKQM